MTRPTDPRRVLYRADALDPDLAQRLARDALAKADDGELYLQYRATESFSFDDGRLKTAAYSTDAGLGLRAVSGEMHGLDRRCVVEGPSVSVRVDLGGRRLIQKKKMICNH